MDRFHKIDFNFEAYKKAAMETAIYPRPFDGVPVYTALGLAGEVGELCEALDTYNTYSVSIGTQFKESREKLILEAGDVLWYIAMLHEDAKLQSIVFYRGHAYDARGLIIGEAMVMCELVKKGMRDGKLNADLTLSCLQNVFDALFTIIYKTSTIEEVAAANIAKLKSRKERGVLQGSGDHR